MMPIRAAGGLFLPRSCGVFRRAPRGVSLLELTVATGVMAVLTALALPMLKSGRDSGHRSVCFSNLRTLGQAIQMYRAENADVLPYAVLPVDLRLDLTAPLPALAKFLEGSPLPHLDESGLISAGEPWICPSDAGWRRGGGFSYLYTPHDLMRTAPDPQPQRAITLFISSDPSVVIMHDLAAWHQGSRHSASLSGRNVLRLDGGVEAGGESVSASPRQYLPRTATRP